MLTRCAWFLSIGGPGTPCAATTVHLGLEAVDYRTRRRLLRAIRGQGTRSGGLLRLPRRDRAGILGGLQRQSHRSGRRAVRGASSRRHHEAIPVGYQLPVGYESRDQVSKATRQPRSLVRDRQTASLDHGIGRYSR